MVEKIEVSKGEWLEATLFTVWFLTFALSIAHGKLLFMVWSAGILFATIVAEYHISMMKVGFVTLRRLKNG